MDKPRILLSRRWPESVEQRLAQSYDVTLNEDDVPLGPDALAAAMREYDAVCPTVTDQLGASAIEGADVRARIIGNFGAGIEHVDLDAARRAGIIVTNTPDVLTDATADIAMTLLLMATRRAGEGERELRAGEWTGWRPTHLLGSSLSGKVLGLVGFGRIARAVADRARAFGMTIAYHSRTPKPDMPEDSYHASLADLLAISDVVSLHAPGGAETRHMIDAAMLKCMKPNAVLLNTGRGTLVDEAALADALRDGTIAAAGLDVFESEPKVHPVLVNLPNVVLLPHLGSATLETREAMGMKVADNLDHFFAGQEPLDRVV
ncbi:D-glycerate dehydrogenase [Altererythrobacter sp. FM1]|uniref:2-hydroxyacid dehydrogenase n=1 Tax=Tsuneonella flava TaxID=2055955 RepID=UPI000C8096D3|nr:D-glycerate dehydrogenase [Tsuneonella flava]ROT96914.1 D-glycerate dehydrogenase [Altererythrobacter sp. FM1]